ncbi:BgTH12-06473 [Blumeria graminis f. sp. triticale]|uniref:dual-specificity kinase n=3 Tax=Blumeria graminis TaxID=34373 RepID=A0A061HIY5_BLUGR|nr:protein kinase [Blumeria graminis f. sp. tritici 96224]CAD6500766.1 BgTH12-06473 [Blumeria graminis f. sp. triticale]VCU41044.1 Bgt-4685 [Blumeria graminis f. sp. tritici]
MSSCAPSTLPPQYPNYGYSHHQTYNSSGNSYRTSSGFLTGNNRIGVSHNYLSSRKTAVSDSLQPSTDCLETYTPHTAASQNQSVVPSTMSNIKKRQRSREVREPDWHKFYQNGLPKEVIVIDDTPTPEPHTATSSRIQPVVSATEADGRHAAKKRRRDNMQPIYDPVYHLGSPHKISNYKDSSGSTVSTDKTASSAHFTATTSLRSLSSLGQISYSVSDVHLGQKRKRTATRLQIANEAKLRELEVNGDAFSSYKPPPKPPIKAPDVQIKQVLDSTFNKTGQVDDKDGHYIVIPESDLTERYQVTKLLGQGTFGKVVQARDRRRNKQVAIKIIRSVQKYRDASRIELRVLSTLKANDNENRNRCIHLRDCFDYRGHICIVMDLLGQSVFDFLKGNSFVPFPNSQIQSFARQLFTSVAFLHDLNLIHTDLKPENILLCDSSYQAFTYSRRIPSSSSSVNRQAAQRKVLLDTEIRLIDFGSATFQDEYHSSVVSTRHYRAPEIILGLGWSFPCDIWSIGCILVEFFTGDALFQTHDNLEHLAMMENVCATRMDVNLIHQVNSMSKKNCGNPASKFFKRLKLDYPQPETSRASRRFVKAMKRLEDIIPENTRFCKNFLDLLKKIFVYDPAKRITAKEALQHEWFKDAAAPDDGTEASKIRLQKQQAANASGNFSQMNTTSRHNEISK